ncbi:type 1 glutamine amidotransferase domain-containing protein [Pontivivens nitratireducens]|uniref:type 1 glutamine amidotransferase domain-containing protein n=1 Tax=Pontivivens nitratireducens TaxID=2758038 RepID=UPI00163B2611|nr:type 1 glutamine amidotransferase domain-containing protein [Pontibrevibacter nitratireducens]
MTKSILMILTSHDTLGDTGEKTGFWLEEFAAPYFVFRDAGHEIVLASPAGGQPPLDPKSDAEDAQTDATRRFKADPAAQSALANTRPLAEISEDAFDAVFYPGGHGPMWDLVGDVKSVALTEAFWAAGKPIGAVCHAPIIFKHARTQTGDYIVADRDVTGFTNGEEDAVGLTDVVPHLVEDVLKERGGNYAKADDFAPFVRIDGHLVTGQNPASSEGAAKALLGLLG